jgi:hypothetical protein
MQAAAPSGLFCTQVMILQKFFKEMWAMARASVHALKSLIGMQMSPAAQSESSLLGSQPPQAFLLTPKHMPTTGESATYLVGNVNLPVMLRAFVVVTSQVRADPLQAPDHLKL